MKNRKRIVSIFFVALLLMSFSLTSMAGMKYDTYNGIYGSLTTGSSQANGTTRNDNGGSSYVSVKAYYRAASGASYWSSPATKSSSSKSVSTSRVVSGTVIGAESAHGTASYSIEFNLNL